MKRSHLSKALVLIALPLLLAVRGSANSLPGNVTKVYDGDTMALMSMKHEITIKLLGIAPPDKRQNFSEEARQHLSDLVLGKFVVVTYSQLGQSFIGGKVMLNDTDIGGQMIRDGVAWFDRTAERLLSDQDRQLYSKCEELARGEHRGLWADQSPVSPWEFRAAEEARLKASQTPLPVPRPRSDHSSAFVPRNTQPLPPGTLAGKPDFSRVFADGIEEGFHRYQPEDRKFSILTPADSVAVTVPVIDAQGKLMDMHYLVGSKDKLIYVAMWAKGSKDDGMDVLSAANSVNQIVHSLNQAVVQSGGRFRVAANPVGNIRVGAYSGTQYKLSGDQLSGMIRVLSKETGDQQDLFMLVVVNSAEDPRATDEFLNSLKIPGR